MVILSGTCAVWRHLFISIASLSWMEVNFLNQKPCISSWPGVFQFDTFLSVVLCKSVWISAFGPSSSSSSSLVIWFIHSAVSLCFLVAIFLSRIVGFLLHPVVGMFYCHLLPIVDWIFFHYLECPILSVWFYPLLISLQSSLFRQDFLVYFLKLYSVFSCVVFSFIPFSCFRSFFLSEFLVEIPILVLSFLSWFFRGSQFYRKLISLLHKLVNLIRLYYSLTYMSVLDSLYLSLP